MVEEGVDAIVITVIVVVVVAAAVVVVVVQSVLEKPAIAKRSCRSGNHSPIVGRRRVAARYRLVAADIHGDFWRLSLGWMRETEVEGVVAEETQLPGTAECPLCRKPQ